MPAKSKKYRRPQIKNPAGSNITSSTQTTDGPSTISPTEKAPITSSKASKTSEVEALVGNYFTREIKWIGLVTAIIIILLIVSYYILR